MKLKLVSNVFISISIITSLILAAFNETCTKNKQNLVHIKYISTVFALYLLIILSILYYVYNCVYNFVKLLILIVFGGKMFFTFDF